MIGKCNDETIASHELPDERCIWRCEARRPKAREERSQRRHQATRGIEKNEESVPLTPNSNEIVHVRRIASLFG